MFYEKPSAQPLGTYIDPVWQAQERNAEMSDFVVHVHEFRDRDSELLNQAGEEHLMSIAARLKKGQDAHVIVEWSKTTPRADTEHKYPVHTNAALDLRRREMVVRLLGAMGVSDADERTIVGPRLTPGISATEAQRSLQTSGGGQRGGGSFGGFFIGGGRF
jgi:hypothetical protein